MLSLYPIDGFLLQGLSSGQLLLPLLCFFLTSAFGFTSKLFFLLLSQSPYLHRFGYFQKAHNEIIEAGFQLGSLPIAPALLKSVDTPRNNLQD